MQSIVGDIVEGSCCAMCGQYFVKVRNIEGADVPVPHEHGYPVACKECWTVECGYDLAVAPTVENF